MRRSKLELQLNCVTAICMCLLFLFPNTSQAAEGDQQWAFETAGRVSSSPAIGYDGTIYTGSEDKKVYAINPNGTQKWTFSTQGIMYSSPAIGPDNTIYLGSGDHNVYAIDSDGIQKWAFETGGSVESSPAVAPDSTIYVGSYDDKLYAINSNGTQKWSFETGDYILSSPAIGSDGTIYVGSQDGKFYAINPDGTQKWAFATHDHVNSSPAIGADGTIYVGSRDYKVYALDEQGKEKWAFETGGRVESSPAIGSDGTIYVGSGDRKVYAINADGTLKWTFETGRSVESSPTIGADGTIYVGSQDKKIYAIYADGTLRWSFETGDWVQSSAVIGPDGTVYLGAHDKRLYAFQGSALGLVASPWPKFRHDMRGTGFWTLISDTLPPTVTVTDPTGDAGDVDVTAAITATFSEALNPSTVLGNFFIRNGSGQVTGEVVYSGATATFTPEADLDFDTNYVATVTVGAEDLAGNTLASNYIWSFTTGANTDSIPPFVTVTNPAHGTTNANVAGSIITTFSEAMNPLTISAATFLVNDGTGNVAGTITLSGATAGFTPTPPSSLDYDTDYFVTITTGAQDLAGNALQDNYTWSFTTETPPDTVSPTVISISPIDDAVDINVNAAIAATFSEDMDVSTINDANFFMEGGSGHIEGTVSSNGTIAVFTPLTTMDYDTDYTVTVTTGAKDLVGNSLQTDYISIFRTEQAPIPSISIIPTALFASGLLENSPPSDSFVLWNSGGGSLNYTVTDDVDWLSCLPDSGTSSGEHDTITIEYSTSDLDPGIYSATIAVDAPGASNDPITIAVTLVVGSQPPMANAGPDQRVDQGDWVVLDGSNSVDVDDGIASYQWEQTAGPVVSLSDDSLAEPSFTAPEEGMDGISLTFQLTVTDTGGLGAIDTCIVNVSTSNEPPEADAGSDQRVSEGHTVVLEGSNSVDVDDGIASYQWEQTAGPVVSLSDDSLAEPSFTAPEEGADGISLTFQLTVTDTGGLGSIDTCIVNVSTSNEPPEAHAGPDQRVSEGHTVVLDGSNSTDTDGSIGFYHWTQTSGVPVTLSVPTAAMPTFVAPPVTANGVELTFQMTVADDVGLGSSDEITVLVDDNGIEGFPEDVITLLTPTNEEMGIELAEGGNCTSLQAVAPSTIADNVGKPDDLIFGLIAMHIKVHTLGGAVDVTIHLPSSAPDGFRWYKYGPGWYDFSDHAVFNADRTEVTLSLVDGGAGDQDGVVNGIIVDPSGLGVAPTAPIAPAAPALTSDNGGDGGGGGGGGGCFISAVGYGFFM